MDVKRDAGRIIQDNGSNEILFSRFFCCWPTTEEATEQDFIGSIILNDSTSVSFNVHYEENVLTFYNGVQESFEVKLSGEDTLRGTFPVFASDLWLVATEGGYKGEYYRTDANNYRLPLELKR